MEPRIRPSQAKGGLTTPSSPRYHEATNGVHVPRTRRVAYPMPLLGANLGAVA